MKTRCLFLLLCASMVGQSQLPHPIFGDVPANATWYHEVNLLRVRMITTGCQANPQMFCAEYDTNGQTPYYLTRGQAAVLIIRSLFSGIHGNTEGFWSDSSPHFTDVVPSHPQFRYIQKMKELGITSGCTTNAYCPDREISYGEIAVFMYRARQKRLAEWEYAEVQPPPACTSSPYWDVPANHAFCPYIAEAKNALGTKAVAPECPYPYFCPDVSFDANQAWIAGVRVRRGPLAFYLVQGILDADYPQSLPNAQTPPPVSALDSVAAPPLECYADQPLFVNLIALAGSELVGVSGTLYITFGGSGSYSFTVAPMLKEDGVVRWQLLAPLTVQGMSANLTSPAIPFDPAKSYEHPVHHEITSACVGTGATIATATGSPTKPFPTMLWANQNVLFRGMSQTLSLRGVSLGQAWDVDLENYGTVGAMVSNVSQSGLTANFTVPFNAPAGEKKVSVVTKFKQEPFGMESDATSISYVTVTVADPTPVLSSLSRDSGTQGEVFSMTLYGGYFGANPRVCLNGVCTNGAGTQVTTNGVTFAQGGCTNCTTSSAQISTTVTIGPEANPGSYSVTVLSQGGSGFGFAPGPQGQQTQPQSGSQDFLVQSLVVSQVAKYNGEIVDPLYLSTGDTSGRIVTTSVVPGTSSFSVTYTVQLLSNPFSNCTASISIPSGGATGFINSPVSAASAPCSGIFSVRARANGVDSLNSNAVVVPPQILVQMLYGEAHGQPRKSDPDLISQRAIGVATRNRFLQPIWGVASYQTAITSSQFDGIATSIQNGPDPELAAASEVFSMTTNVSVENAGCFFSPTPSGWNTILSAYQSQTTTVPTVIGDPLCYAGTTHGRQLIIKTSIGLNAVVPGVPAFIFVQARPSSSAPAVIQIP